MCVPKSKGRVIVYYFKFKINLIFVFNLIFSFSPHFTFSIFLHQYFHSFPVYGERVMNRKLHAVTHRNRDCNVQSF